MNKALFLDRDGVINIDKHGYTYKVDELEFVPGILDFCLLAKQRGYLLVVVTNQSGIGRGYYTTEDFWTFMNEIQAQMLASHGLKFDAIYFCQHAPELNCECRKPKPGMILQAIEDLSINPTQSLLIGDKPTDILSATSAGITKTILFDYNTECLKNYIYLLNDTIV